MNYSRVIELAVGIFVALGVAALFFLAVHVSNLGQITGTDGYKVTARFDNIGGLRVRAPVTVAGVRVGRVTHIDYDDDRFEAVVTMSIERRYDRLPADSDASIYTSGLLGEQYVAIQPGGDDMHLSDGDEIMFTQSALVLERLIGRFVTQMGDD